MSIIFLSRAYLMLSHQNYFVGKVHIIFYCFSIIIIVNIILTAVRRRLLDRPLPKTSSCLGKKLGFIVNPQHNHHNVCCWCVRVHQLVALVLPNHKHAIDYLKLVGAITRRYQYHHHELCLLF